METHFDFCVVCTSQYELTSGNGAVKQERLDNEDFRFIASDRDEHPDSAYEEAHLEPLFFLRNILEVATEKLEELNSSQDPLAPANGLEAPLCPPCRVLARQFYETTEQVSRLQMILSEIKGKFMERIQQNKDAECQSSSSSWKEVRRQVLLTSFGDDRLPNREESDEFEEEWHFGEIRIKSEVGNEPDEDDDGSSFRVPASPQSSSVLLFDSTSTLVDDEGVNENLPRSSSALPPSKASKKVVQPRVIRRRRKGSSKNWSKKKGMTTLRTQVLLECAHCTYYTMHMSRFTDHQTVHEPNSGATSCEICGIYVLPTRMNLHIGFSHPPQLRKTVRNKMKEFTKKNQMPNPLPKRKNVKRNPNFTVKFVKGRRWFICRKCPYKAVRRGEIDKHAGLHSEDSSAVPCELCNISLLPERMELHQATNHSVLQPEEPIVKKKAPVIFKCAHCPHQAKGRKHSEDHATLHSEGSGGIPCPNCDVYYRPNPIISSGHNCGKWKRLKKLRLIKARRSMSRNETSSKLSNPE